MLSVCLLLSLLAGALRNELAVVMMVMAPAPIGELEQELEQNGQKERKLVQNSG